MINERTSALERLLSARQAIARLSRLRRTYEAMLYQLREVAVLMAQMMKAEDAAGERLEAEIARELEEAGDYTDRPEVRVR